MIKLKILIRLICIWLCFAPEAFAIDSPDLLEPELAFPVHAEGNKANLAVFSWDVAAGFYLYRQQIKIVSLTPGVAVDKLILPPGQTKHDEFFGEVEIYRGHVAVDVILRQQNPDAKSAKFEVTSRGCSDVGVCYPPMQNVVTVNLLPGQIDEPTANPNNAEPGTIDVSEQDRIADSLKNRSVWYTALAFLGFGLLLAFTPCVFPMIPILSGIVAGQGQHLTTRRAFGLSLSYVLASSVTYTAFGVLAGLFGNNLQAFFQEPWVISVFSGIFILLALSMFGFFQFQMPAFIQTKVVSLSSRQRGGNLLGAAVMGVLSTLIVGPCVTAPLTGTLIYIGQTGDAILGGLALFALGIGMGLPLLIIGSSAGKWLPKAGAWMNIIKAFFGVGLLAVAVWLLSRILPPNVTLLLWAFLLTIPLMILSWHKRWKGLLLFVLLYGGFLIAGLSRRFDEPFSMLLCNVAVACEKPSALAFNKIQSLEDLHHKLTEAQAKGQWVMLDFYADWCTACQEMEHMTFGNPKVRSALSGMILLQADVTQNTIDDRVLLKQWRLIGPPAILFFGPDQQEREAFRVVGFQHAEAFLDHLKQVFQ